MPIKINVHAKYLLCLFWNVYSFENSFFSICTGNAELTDRWGMVPGLPRIYRCFGKRDLKTSIPQFLVDAVQAFGWPCTGQMAQQGEFASSAGRGL